MPMHTITAMFHTREEAERAASRLRSDSSYGTTNIKVLPEADDGRTTQEGGGFLDALRHFFMPEEDRYGFAEGMRRGDYMLAADVDEAHGHEVMNLLEHEGAIDLDAEEARWRSEGWQGHTASGAGMAAAAASGVAGGAGSQTAATIPPVPGGATSTTGSTATGSASTGPMATRSSTTGVTGTGTTAGVGSATTGVRATGTAAGTSGSALGREGTVGTGTEERIALAEEQLRVGKRVAAQGRVRIRSYVVETPVSETVHLRDERVDVERRAVDRPVTASDVDPFREREIEATETREEPVVSKEARIREELVLHKSVEEHDETIRDTVRRTEVKEEHDGDNVSRTGTTRDPGKTGSI